MDKKRDVLPILVFCLFFFGCATIGRDPLWDGDFQYRIVRNRAVTIIDYRGTSQDINIPPYIRGLPVTKIGDSAFRGKGLVSVIIPDSVTSIGYSAFRDNSLTNVTLPGGVTSIGQHAFRANRLTSLTIPENVTTLERAVFRSNRLTCLTLPEGLRSIGMEAFGWNRLASVTIPESVTTLERSAFRNNLLVNLTLPEGLRSVEREVFMNNSRLISVTIPERVASIDGVAAMFDSCLRGILNVYGVQSGTYERRSDKWFLNDSETAFIQPARLVLGRGVEVNRINGRNHVSSTEAFLVPGSNNIEIRFSTRSAWSGLVALEHEFQSGGIYDLSGTISGNQIVFEIAKR